MVAETWQCGRPLMSDKVNNGVPSPARPRRRPTPWTSVVLLMLINIKFIRRVATSPRRALPAAVRPRRGAQCAASLVSLRRETSAFHYATVYQ